VVPFAAGGPSDAMARILGDRMKATLGQAFVIENVTGAGGSIGLAARCARRPMATPSASGTSARTWRTRRSIHCKYDMLTDLDPVVLLPRQSDGHVSRNSLPAKSLQELIAWLKANPDKASAGTAGAGSGSHIAGVYLQNLTGLRFQFVPYRGTAPALTDSSPARSTSLSIRPRTRCSRSARQHPRLCDHRPQAALSRARYSDRDELACRVST